MTALLDLREVRAGYGSGPDILNGLSLHVEEGRTACIIGPNGAGKSSILKAVMGLVRVRAGTITFQGRRIDGLRPDQVLAQGIGFIPQERTLFPAMTVRENLVMAGYRLPGRAAVARGIAEVYERFPHVRELAGRRAAELSGGQQQTVALARAVLLRPALLMVDEPTLGLAPAATDQVFAMLADLRDTGMTVLLVEQNVRKGLDVAAHAHVVELGALRMEDSADRVLAHPEIRELYLGRRVTRQTTRRQT